MLRKLADTWLPPILCALGRASLCPDDIAVDMERTLPKGERASADEICAAYGIAVCIGAGIDARMYGPLLAMITHDMSESQLSMVAAFPVREALELSAAFNTESTEGLFEAGAGLGIAANDLLALWSERQKAACYPTRDLSVGRILSEHRHLLEWQKRHVVPRGVGLIEHIEQQPPILDGIFSAVNAANDNGEPKLITDEDQAAFYKTLSRVQSELVSSLEFERELEPLKKPEKPN